MTDLYCLSIQNLRVYERHGLVRPSRTTGGTRLYSPADVERLLEIRVLLARGLNLAGIAIVLDLRSDVVRLQVENEVLQRQLDDSSIRPNY